MTTDDESDRRDMLWRMGNRAAWREVLALAMKELGYDDPKFVESNYWMWEREAAIAQLRTLCEEFGDNDWDEKLHLADVIEKHLGWYLESDDEDE